MLVHVALNGAEDNVLLLLNAILLLKDALKRILGWVARSQIAGTGAAGPT